MTTEKLKSNPNQQKSQRQGSEGYDPNQPRAITEEIDLAKYLLKRLLSKADPSSIQDADLVRTFHTIVMAKILIRRLEKLQTLPEEDKQEHQRLRMVMSMLYNGHRQPSANRLELLME